MKEWSLKAGDPLALTLAADFRLCQLNFANDVIWELSIGGGDPDALAIQTTFGLRTGGMRLFPRFVRKEGTISDPAKFHQPPLVQEIVPNYIRLNFSPFSGVGVTAEYRVVSSTVISGRFTFHNKSLIKEQFRLEWVGVLNPLGAGQGMAVVNLDNQTVLEGGSDGLHLVSLLSGPARTGSGTLAALAQEVELIPGGRATATWALGAASTVEEAFTAAQTAIQTRFDGEVAHIHLRNEADGLEISTGNTDWDAALHMTQRAARLLFFPPGGGLPYPSFVLNRRPDQGASLRGDGSDYTSLWSGQTVLDAYFISSLLLPGGLEQVIGVVRNFLSRQDENGQIDWRLGLGGQRSRRMAQPMLASLALSAAEFCGETEWLKDIYPGLARFLRAWFSPLHDRDGDGFPEWDHPLQTGLEDAPMYDRWNPGGQGLDLNILEAPGLAAMLVRECRSLARIGRLLSAEADVPWLEEQADRLSAALRQAWDKENSIYHYQDHETHSRQGGRRLLDFKGSASIKVKYDFDSPMRLFYSVRSADQSTRIASIHVFGKLNDEIVEEEIAARDFSWVNGQGRSTGRKLFTRINRVEINGLLEDDFGWISLPDYLMEDISLLLPLWAGIPSEDQARQMVEKKLLQEWLEPYGLGLCPPAERFEDAEKTAGVLMPWNHLVGEGLLAYGYRNQAAVLIRYLMEGVVLNLRKYHDFRSPIHAKSGNPMGEFGHLHGMAPLGLLLRTAGIHQFSEKRLIVQIGSPFSHAITVKYKGAGVTLSAKEVIVTSPSGQVVRISEPGLHRIDWR